MKVAALKNSAGSIGVVALDEAYLLAQLLGLSLEEPSNEALLNEVLSTLLDVYHSQATGIVVDSVYSMPLLKEGNGKATLLVDLEQIHEPEPMALPKLVKNWGIENIRNMYGMAKLEMYYHPAEEKALEKKQFVSEIYDFCEYEEIDFLLKIMIYSPTKDSLDIPNFQEAQLETVSELQRFTSVLALQYPQDPLAVATLTSSLDVPWLLVSDDTKYDTFKEYLRVSVENGAEGFLAGEVLWEEIGGMRLEDHRPHIEEIKKFIVTTGKDRIIELIRIVQEESQ